MEFDWTESQRAYRAQLRTFLEDHLPLDWWENYAINGPGSHKQMQFARQFGPLLAKEGLLTRHWPKRYGGQDGETWEHIILSEEMWSAGEPRSANYMGANWAGPAIMLFGTDEQKDFFLPRIAGGQLLFCQGFSEPSAGSDLASLRTSATPDGDDYIIEGSKIWTSYAHSADYCFLLARVGSQGRTGVTVFLIPMDTPGITVKPIASLDGEGEFHEVFWTQVRVPASCRLGEEGGGWSVVRAVLHGERVGAARYEATERSLMHAVTYLMERGRFEESAVRIRAAQVLSQCRASRLLTYFVMDGRAHKREPTADTSIARVSMIEACHAYVRFMTEFVPEAMVGGGTARMKPNLASARVSGIAAGAAEIQLDLISRGYLNLPRKD